MLIRTLPLYLITTAISLAAMGCGGGGGGGGTYSGAASASISVAPSSIDSGDRARVEVSLGDVHENGIALKFRYPQGLAYVPSSAFLIIDDNEIDISPSVNVTSTEDEKVYLIFYLAQSLFHREGQDYNGEPGTVRFQLAGKSAVKNGLVEIDPDVDDPNVSNSTEFSLEKPEFLAEDQAYVSVSVER
jgi:hypothetical protein